MLKGSDPGAGSNESVKAGGAPACSRLCVFVCLTRKNHKLPSATVRLSFTPCLSGVGLNPGRRELFQQFPRPVETVETVSPAQAPRPTPLKQGVNEKAIRTLAEVCDLSGLGPAWGLDTQAPRQHAGRMNTGATAFL